jgi:arabinose-5-phosphate isomerase
MMNTKTIPQDKNYSTDQQNSIDLACQVIEREIEGLTALKATIGAEFLESVEAIDNIRKNGNGGRLIIAGIGKSGHIARKLAATFASTGMPAFFVHPGEASHGDLGMITRNDVVLMLSNSGENSELSDLIHYTRRFSIKLIAITSNIDSTLATHADIVLLIPKSPEACPNGLAPTTSTTVMLALGDALAVTLLSKMGLTEEQFKVFHPGGKLGQKLQKVSDLMHHYEDLPLVNENEKMDRAIIVLSEKNLGSVLVINEEKQLVGIVTDGDLKRHMSSDLLTKYVREIMSHKPLSIQSSALAVEAMNLMTRTPGKYVTSLIVNDQEGNLTGLIRLQDCLQAGIA